MTTTLKIGEVRSVGQQLWLKRERIEHTGHSLPQRQEDRTDILRNICKNKRKHIKSVPNNIYLLFNAVCNIMSNTI